MGTGSVVHKVRAWVSDKPDLGEVIENSHFHPFNVDLEPLEAALEKGDIRTGVDIDRRGAWVKYQCDTYILRVDLTRTTGQVVFTVGNKDGKPHGAVHLTVTDVSDKERKARVYPSRIYPLCLTKSREDSRWVNRSELTERVGPGPYNVVVTPVRSGPL